MEYKQIVLWLIIGLIAYCVLLSALTIEHSIRYRRGKSPFNMLFRFYTRHQVQAANYNKDFRHRARHNRLQRAFFIGLLVLLALVVAAFEWGILVL